MVAITVALVAGAVTMFAVARLLGGWGGRRSVTLLPSIVPTAFMLWRTVFHPSPARADDDDTSWVVYSLHRVLYGRVGRLVVRAGRVRRLRLRLARFATAGRSPAIAAVVACSAGPVYARARVERVSDPTLAGRS